MERALISTQALAGIETSRSPVWLVSRYSPTRPGSPSYVIRPPPEFTSTDGPVTLRRLTLPRTEWMSTWLLRMSVKVIGPLRVFTCRWASLMSVTSTEPDAASRTTSPRSPCARRVPSDDRRVTKAALGTSTGYSTRLMPWRLEIERSSMWLPCCSFTTLIASEWNIVSTNTWLLPEGLTVMGP